MVEHTPGPWHFDRDLDPENEPVIWSSDGFNVATVETGAARDEDQIVANAHLIAAAPELLAVCREALKTYEGVQFFIARTGVDTTEVDKRVTQMRAAIAKAEKA